MHTRVCTGKPVLLALRHSLAVVMMHAEILYYYIYTLYIVHTLFMQLLDSLSSASHQTNVPALLALSSLPPLCLSRYLSLLFLHPNYSYYFPKHVLHYAVFLSLFFRQIHRSVSFFSFLDSSSSIFYPFYASPLSLSLIESY